MEQVISVRVEADLAEKFAAVAEANDRSVSAEIRRLMREHVEKKKGQS